MTKQIINIGSTANDRSGDSLRASFDKVNQNFTELYDAMSADVQIPVQTNNSGKYLTTNGTTLSWGEVTVPTDIAELTDNTGLLGGGTGNIAFDGSSIYTTDVEGWLYLANGNRNNEDDTAGIFIPPHDSTNETLTIQNFTTGGDVRIGNQGGWWYFKDDGNLQLPFGGDIVNSSGISILTNKVSSAVNSLRPEVQLDDIRAGINGSGQPYIGSVADGHGCSWCMQAQVYDNNTFNYVVTNNGGNAVPLSTTVDQLLGPTFGRQGDLVFGTFLDGFGEHVYKITWICGGGTIDYGTVIIERLV